jgi:hypothetical protein
MRKILRAGALTALAIAFAGCAQAEAEPMAGPAAGGEHGYPTAIAKAERHKSAAVGGEWRDTAAILQSTGHAAGQYRRGREQAAGRVNVGNPAYLY